MNTLLILLVPFGYFLFLIIRSVLQNKRARKRQRELARAYNRSILQRRVIIDHSEIIGFMVIALNRHRKELLVIDHNDTGKKEFLIGLSTVADSKIIENRNDRNELDSIGLRLSLTGTTIPVIISFRPSDNSPGEEQGLLKTARRWKNLVDIHKYAARPESMVAYPGKVKHP